jgi:polysaccharide biosynthesis protein PslI
MRIGIDYRAVTAAPLSGIARQVMALEQALLSRSGTDVVRFTAGPMDHPHRARACCPPWPSPAQGLHRPQERLKFELGFLPRALRETRMDAYIATANAGLPAWRPPRQVRYVVLLHDVFQLTMDNRHDHWMKAAVYRQFDRLEIGHSVRLADQIWCPSRFTMQEASKLFPRRTGRMHVLPNAVPPMAIPATEPMKGLPSRGFWLLVGTREPRKNVPWFLEQWSAVRAGHADEVPELVLVGSSGDVPENLRALPGCHFVSGISDAQLQALYASADRLWQPSRAEGFGLPAVEALWHGTPVAVARGSALDEVVPGDCVRFDPDDGSGLQQLMLRLARTGRQPAENAEGLIQWASRYDLPDYQKKVWGLLDRLLDKVDR